MRGKRTRRVVHPRSVASRVLSPEDRALAKSLTLRTIVQQGELPPHFPGVADLPGFADSLRLLIQRERYTLSDIALMFGVSTERIRQLAQRFGITRDKAGPSGGITRVWDDTAHCFYPVHSHTAVRVRGSQKAKVRHDERLRRTRDRLWAAVDAFHSARRRLRRAPFNDEWLAEIARRDPVARARVQTLCATRTPRELIAAIGPYLASYLRETLNLTDSGEWSSVPLQPSAPSGRQAANILSTFRMRYLNGHGPPQGGSPRRRSKGEAPGAHLRHLFDACQDQASQGQAQHPRTDG